MTPTIRCLPGIGHDLSGQRLVLASASPRRRELLERIGLTFDVVAADLDEAPLDDERPVDHVARLAVAKALAVPRRRGAVVIAADTTIDLDGRIVGKPADRDDATAMLMRLAGRRHEVHTAIAVRHEDVRDDDSVEDHDVEVTTTAVEMIPADRHLIDWYVSTGEPLDKAGGYAIQGAGDLLVSRVEGSVSNVIGLPLTTLVTMLERVTGARDTGPR